MKEKPKKTQHEIILIIGIFIFYYILIVFGHNLVDLIKDFLLERIFNSLLFVNMSVTLLEILFFVLALIRFRNYYQGPKENKYFSKNGKINFVFLVLAIFFGMELLFYSIPFIINTIFFGFR